MRVMNMREFNCSLLGCKVYSGNGWVIAFRGFMTRRRVDGRVVFSQGAYVRQTYKGVDGGSYSCYTDEMLRNAENSARSLISGGRVFV